MSDEPENGSGPRATVSLVDAKVDTVLAEVRGGFKDVQRQLDDLHSLPARVTGLSDRQLLLEARVTKIEDSDALAFTDKQRRSAYRTVHLPSLMIGAAGLVLTVLALAGVFH